MFRVVKSRHRLDLVDEVHAGVACEIANQRGLAVDGLTRLLYQELSPSVAVGNAGHGRTGVWALPGGELALSIAQI